MSNHNKRFRQVIRKYYMAIIASLEPKDKLERATSCAFDFFQKSCIEDASITKTYRTNDVKGIDKRTKTDSTQTTNQRLIDCVGV